MPVASYVATGTALRAAIRSLRGEGFPSPPPSPACFACLCPASGHRLFLCPRMAPVPKDASAVAQSPYGRPALLRATRYMHGLPPSCVRSPQPIASSTGPGYHALLSSPGSPDDSTSPLSEDEACHKRSDKRVREGWADRMMTRKAVVIRSDTAPGKGTRVFKKVLLPCLPSRKETP